jgi:hypothetical protein
LTVYCPLHRCAFLHFCCAKRPKLKQENPSLSVGSLAKQLSSAWKLMTPEQKKPYDLLAEKDKQRYIIWCTDQKLLSRCTCELVVMSQALQADPTKIGVSVRDRVVFQEKVELSWEGFILSL